MTKLRYTRARLASKYRLLAGQLYYVDCPRVKDKEVEDQIKVAHDALCKAFMALEELVGKD